MSYQPIENYGIIGNMRTVALVGMNGSIDWYCYPHFDSPSIFGAILDDNQGGRFQICPVGDQVRHKQFYWPSTNILITRFLLPDGIAELEDFMPVGLPSDSPWYQHLYRRIRCVRGAVRISLICRPAFDYGRKSHETVLDDQGALFDSGSLSIVLSAAVPLTQDGQGGVAAEFTLEEGKSQVFILRDHGATETVPCSPTEGEAEELFQNTVKFWRKWLSACTYQGRWQEQVHRSALALKLLTFDPTGAIIAPELPGGNAWRRVFQANKAKREHLAILDLLNVCNGAVALTKVDRVAPSRVGEVQGEIAALLTGTTLEGAPIIPVSAMTGEGIPALKQHLIW